MGLAKRIGKLEGVRVLLCWLVAQYIRLVHATGRWRTQGGDVPAAFWDRREPFILAFWHGRLLMMPRLWRGGMPIHMLISQHRDGLLIARTVAHLGISTVAGSSTRGGGSAMRSLMRLLKDGGCIGITPDGPRGPRMRVSMGTVTIARLSGRAIVPAACSARHRTLLRSWDRFLVPRPFTDGVFVWGAPMRLDKDCDEAAQEAFRLALERELTRLTDLADSLVGAEPVPPAAEEGS
ncbi:lysophospholipid acyltransferase family protein [Magnetospirillum sp. UT-4]|uniref:lysophospholipid acyltransferase family protein n=1 Tax=Magnetospirillum sp. UT-4 TaxID=2681467 RepID=UPI0013849D42|nr:lysophospholipid acyltransferase family protein [Magnetospirillum sp. UT-4]CAA7620112.1 conserved hypothetical protein [Magnetospirillum sp. UT-4]